MRSIAVTPLSEYPVDVVHCAEFVAVAPKPERVCTVRVDCQTCPVRLVGCGDCVVAVLWAGESAHSADLADAAATRTTGWIGGV